MSEIRYIESGYIEAGYFEVIQVSDAISLSATSSISCTAEAFIADERYIEEGYIEAGYFEVTKYLEETELTSSATISASLTELVGVTHEASASLSGAFSQSTDAGKILQGSANFGGLFSPSLIVGVLKTSAVDVMDPQFDLSVTVSKFTGNEATLDNIISLSLQGNRYADFASSLSSDFAQSTTPSRQRVTDSTLSTTTSLTATANTNVDVTAPLTVQSTVTADVIALTKTFAFNRINNLDLYVHSTSAGSNNTYNTLYTPGNAVDAAEADFSTDDVFFGNSSYRFYSLTDTKHLMSDTLGGDIAQGDNFYIEFWRKTDGDFFSHNGNNNPALTAFISSRYDRDININEAAFQQYFGQSSNTAIEFGWESSTAKAKVRFSDGTTTTLTTTSTFSTGNWQRWRLYRVNNVISFNVTRWTGTTYPEYTGSNAYTTYSASNVTNNKAISTSSKRLFLQPGFSLFNFSGKVYFDNTIVKLGHDNGIIKDITSVSNFPDPADFTANEQLNSYDDTAAYYKFENTLDDYTPVVYNETIELTVNAAQITAFGYNATGSVSMESVASVTADIDIIKPGSAVLSSSFDSIQNGTRLRFADSTQNTQADVTAAVNIISGTDATLTSQATLTADVGKILQGDIDTDSIASVLTVIAKISDFFINCDVVVSTVTDAVKTAVFDADVNSEATVTSNETTLFKTFDATLNTQFIPSFSTVVIRDGGAILTDDVSVIVTTTGSKIAGFDAVLSALCSSEVEPNPIKDVEVAVNSEFSTTAAVDRIRAFASDISTQATLTSAPIKSVTAEGDFETAITTSIDGIRIRFADIDTDSIATQLSAVAKIGDFILDIDAVASLEADVSVTTGNVIVQEATSTIECEPLRIQQLEADVNSIATLTSAPIKGVVAELGMESVFETDVDAVKTIEATATLSGTGGFLISVRAIRNNEIDLISTFAQDTQGIRKRFADATCDAVVTAETTASRLVSVGSVINTVASTSSTVRVIQIDEIVYVVPAESREYTVFAETKEYAVKKETREYTIPGAN